MKLLARVRWFLGTPRRRRIALVCAAWCWSYAQYLNDMIMQRYLDTSVKGTIIEQKKVLFWVRAAHRYNRVGHGFEPFDSRVESDPHM